MNNLKKILIIEDEKTILEVMVKKLEKEGFSVLTASDGKSGLNTALTEKPDLVLLDIVLPEMDGLTLLEELRKSDIGKNLPVIVLTNLENSENLEESKRKGVYDYLIKTDLSLEDVVKKVKSALKVT